jgi:3-mercaptopyruvate sulfurtransferase SseA
VLPPDRAVRLCGDRGVLVADARPPQRFAEGHVSDAVHLPCAAPSADATSVVASLRDKHTLIVYGDSTAEARPVAEDLRRRIGRPDLRVVVLDGGFPAWSQAGLACSSGPCPQCTQPK